MGLYDMYRLSNSSAIPRYAGAPLQELQQDLSFNKGLYDTGLSIMDQTADLTNRVRALPASQKALDEVNGATKADMEAMAKQGDLENMLPRIGKMARNYNNQIEAFGTEFARYQKFESDLEKEKDINADTKAKYRQYALMSHQGVQKDPSTGMYRATFSEPMLQKDINLVDWTKKALGDYASRKYGTNFRYETKDGETWIRSGDKTEKVTPDMLKTVLAAAKQDPEFQSFVNREKLLNTMHYRGARPEAYSPESQQTIAQYAATNGLDFRQAALKLAMDDEGKRIDNTISGLANKYIVDNYEGNRETGSTDLGTYNAKDRADNSKWGPAFAGAAPLMNMTYKDQASFQQDIKAKQDNLAASETKVSSILGRRMDRYAIAKLSDAEIENSKLPPETKTALITERAAVQQTMHEASTAMNTVSAYHQKAAEEVGLKVDPTIIEKSMGVKSLTDPKTGKHYDISEVVSRYLQNRDSPGLYSFSTTDYTKKPMTFRTDEGREITIPERFRPALTKTLREMNGGDNVISDNQVYREVLHKYGAVKGKVDDYMSNPPSVTQQMITLSKPVSEQLSKMAESGNPNMKLVDQKGELQDIPKNWKNVKVEFMAKDSYNGGPAYNITYDEIGSDGKIKEAGKRGFVTFPQSGVDAFVGMNMLKSKDPQMKQIGLETLATQRFHLEGLINNALEVKDVQSRNIPLDSLEPGLSVSIKQHRYPDGSYSPTPFYQVFKDGKPVTKMTETPKDGAKGNPVPLSGTTAGNILSYVIAYELDKEK